MRVSLSIEEVSNMTGISESNIYKLIRSGDLLAKKLGRKTLILKTDLDNFMNNLEPVQLRNQNTQKD